MKIQSTLLAFACLNLLTSPSIAKGLPNRSCTRVYDAKSISKAKYLACFNQGVLSELDFSTNPISGSTFPSVPLKIKGCHGTSPPHQANYTQVTKTIRSDGGWNVSLGKIDNRFGDVLEDNFFISQDTPNGMDSSSRIDSVGSGWCYWLEKPLGQQPATENCVNALACSRLWPEYCNCTWP